MAFAFRSYFSKKVSNVGITVVRIDQKASQPCKFVHFNLSDNLSKLGIGVSIGTSKSKESCVETNYSYRFIKYGKASLKLKYEHLEPTPEFIKVIENAISSEDPAEQFKQILKDFGQFIPTDVILGGRVHYDYFTKSVKHTVGKSNKFSRNINIGDLKGELGKGSTNSEENSNNYSRRYTKVIGGEQPDNIESLDIGNWVSSLNKSYENWDCIEFRDPVIIFQLLPEDLRKRIIKSVGMKIHHLDTENHNCVLEEFRKPIQFNLSIPNEISKIIKNKDIDFKIFATVTDITKSKNDFFTYKCLVKLPNFTFYTLKITNYHNRGACDTITLRRKEYSNFNTESPKFVSIYSAEKTDCVFLKQRNGQVKIKKIGNDNTAILSVKCAIFDPYCQAHQVETL
ncbi:hypothetical protein RhiirA1_474840 [Rhizophagus irregularis]|uniref:Uncharacterized protein n=1 Tax=Rhizophagus irregularis TaxID=588596 RepID=A0A2N0QXV8_9GLOM|nr:hypothetical protein RhiirA1_474840 [Rhizophagus irregularis]